MPFEVQQWCVIGGWQNTWSEDGQSQTFPTREAAQKEIDEFIADVNSDGRTPNEFWDAEEFRIEELPR